MSHSGGGDLKREQDDSDEGEFQRDLSVYALLAMSLGTVIGSGWLLLPGIVAAKAGPASVFSWIIAGLMMLVVAAVYAELGATWPAPGAVAKYPHMSHGQFVGHMAGWAAFVAYVVTPAAEAVAVVRYAGSVWPPLVNGDALTSLGIALSIAILIAITLLCYTSVKYLGIFETYVTALKYIPIILFLVLIPVLAFNPVNFTAYGGFAPTGPSGILLGTASTLFAFIGFRQALDFGAEAKNPGRDLPRAVLGTIVIATITYILISIVFVGGISWSGLSGLSTVSGVTTGNWSSLSGLPSPMYDLAAATGIGFLATVILADGIISPNGPNASNVGTVPRITYTMAEDGTMPKFFLRLHPKYGTPDAGLIFAFFVEVGFLFVTAAGYSTLIDVVNAAFAVGFATGPVALVALRRTAPHVNRHYTLTGGRFWGPVAFFFASLLLYWEGWPLTGYVIAVLFFGAIVYFAFAYWADASIAAIRNGLWYIGWFLAMAAVSYLGSGQFGGINIIPLGWDIPTIAVISLVFFYWGVSQCIPYDEANEPKSATVEKTGPAPTDVSLDD